MTWEYKVVPISNRITTVELEALLNQLGDDRWELVRMTSVVTHLHDEDEMWDGRSRALVLKRPGA